MITKAITDPAKSVLECHPPSHSKCNIEKLPLELHILIIQQLNFTDSQHYCLALQMTQEAAFQYFDFNSNLCHDSLEMSWKLDINTPGKATAMLRNKTLMNAG